MDIDQISLSIGPYKLHSISTGRFGLDGGAMFGTVPKVLWEKDHPTDEFNRIEMEARILLLISEQRKVLIDTGNGGDFIEKYGEKKGSKFAQLFAIDEGNRIDQELQRFALSSEDITDVILTHLHFDHAGGATRAVDGKLVPSFPRAQYWVQKGNLETAKNPNLREKASYLSPNFAPLLEAGVLKLIDGEQEELLPHLSVYLSNGHTAHQQVVQIQDDKNTLLYCADLIPTRSHLRLPWVMGYDLRPLDLIEEKRRFLSKAADHDWFLFLEHDPIFDVAQAERHGEDFRFRKGFYLN